MTNKKQQILNTARELFNAKGFFNVTIRMIAQELNMSSGNLNYHFNKRETIFEALYFEMVSVFDQRLEDLPNTNISIQQIRMDIEISMLRMTDYTFFWTDLYQLLKVSSKVKEHFLTVYSLRKEAYDLLFKTMIEKKLLKKPSYSLEYRILADHMLSYSNTWLYESNLYNSNDDKKNIAPPVNMLLGMLYPYLSQKGKEEYKKLLPNTFKN